MSDVQIAVIDQQDTQIVLAVPGVQGATGSSIPSGGTTDQVLRKNSSTDYDANWTQVTSAMIADGTIVNADVNASAAIAGTKISPDFGGQTVTTTGQVNAARVNVTVNTAPTNGIYLPASNTVGISTNGTGRLFVDSSGRLLVGASSASTTGTAVFQGNSGGATSHGIINIARGATNPGVNLSLGFTQFQDAAGSVGAQIYAQTDAAWSIGSYAGRLVFSTTADGASSPTERLRITSAGLVGIGTSSPGSVLDLGVGTTGRALSWHNTSTVSYGHIWNSYGSGAVVLAHALKGSTSVSDGFESSISTSRARSALELKSGTINLYTDPASTVAYGTSFTPTPRLSIDSSGRVGIGTTSPLFPLDVNGVIYTRGRGSTFGVLFDDWRIYNSTAPGALVFDNGTERARIDSSGRLLVGTSTLRAVEPNGGSASGATLTTHFEGISSIPASVGLIHNGTTAAEGSALYLARTRGTAVASSTLVALGDTLGTIAFAGGDGTDIRTKAAEIYAVVDGTPGADDMPGRLVFSTTSDGASSPTERMRIVNDGTTLIGKTASSISTAGTEIGSGAVWTTRDAATAMRVNRLTDDGTLVEFLQASVAEGTISVSGTTVSYNGAHLSRWSQLPSGAERTEILRGSVLSNIDEMCEWSDEDNEQLNRMKVSDVEGDKNVSGVFQAWDDDDDTYTNDFYCAMTGDFIIRIAAGVTVERGDLLMSAGDGTAKPQDDDIIRSKTIAKVTSTNVSCTYEDGSYCVPCVLMAC